MRLRAASARQRPILKPEHAALTKRLRRCLAPTLLLLLAAPAFAGTLAELCPRPASGATVQPPPELRSQHGILEVTFHFKYEPTMAGQGPPRYCYLTDRGVESPTLRVHPGDQLIIHLHNDLPAAILDPDHAAMAAAPGTKQPDCNATSMSAAVTNLHFHGLTVPPTCHQDDVIRTAIAAGEDFDYRMTIPRDEPPGLYWYHPHPHGYSERQVQGGASGALIVEGLEKVDPSLAKMPQRVIVLRDQTLIDTAFVDPRTPAWDISINYVPVTYPRFEPATIETRPGEKELWRVLNAAADTIFHLQIMAGGVAQAVKVVAMDGVPASGAPHAETSILLPPGARAEFVMETPKAGEPAQLVTTMWDTGPQGDSEPARPIANIVSNSDADEPSGGAESAATKRWRPRNDGVPVEQRRLYFSQYSPNPGEADSSVFYFVTVAGQVPAMYRMGQPPNIVVHEGDVEDWTVENRSQEDHVFHIHQIHFRVLEIDGKPANDPTMRDTIDLPYWKGSGPYPRVKLRMDFRDPNAVGTFLYHCHILKHEDMGMMGVIQVQPPGVPTVTTVEPPAGIQTATLVTIVASVAGKTAAPTAPGGEVQFMIDGITAGKPVPVVNGRAELTTSFDAAGEQVITAIYAGDATYDESASRPRRVRVSE